MEDLVSVIIPTYKRKIELKRAIDSVLNQTYKNIEIIIVDDNGPETEWSKNVKDIISKYEGIDNIKYIVNERNIGGAETRNVGIKNAKGEYIAFLDDDDEYYSEKISKQVKLFKESLDEKLALVYCYTESYDENNNKLHEYKYDHIGNCLFEAMCGCIAATSQWLCKTEYLNQIGRFTDVPSKQDSTVIIKFLNEGFTVNRVPEILLRYNEHSNERISSGGLKNIEGEKLLRSFCRKIYNKLDNKEKNKIESEFSYRLAKLYIKNRMYNEAKSELKNITNIDLYRSLKMQVYYIINKLNNSK